MVLRPLVEKDENVTLRSRTKKYLLREFGAGKIFFISFVVNTTKKVSLRIVIDNVEYELPTIEFLIDLGITGRNRTMYCHVVDDSTPKYGMLVLKEFQFSEKIEIYLLNEHTSDVTILKYLILGEVESK